MKKLFPMLILAITTLIAFSACSDDDNNPTEPNYFQVGEQKFDLTYAKMRWWDEGENLQGFDLWIYEKEDEYGEIEGDFFVTNIYNLYCTGENGVLKSGTYTYSPDQHTDLTHNGWSDWWDVNSEVWIEFGETMTLRVTNHGNNVYEFSWSGTDENGDSVKGHYKGSVAVFKGGGVWVE